MGVTVITATVPERSELLAECVASVQKQTVQVEHLIGVDKSHVGPVTVLNDLASQVGTEWVFRLDDDDLLDRDHFQTLSYWCDDDTDIVYSWCRVEGGGKDIPANRYQVRLQDEYGWGYLHVQNWIPCAAAVRTSLWRDLGGLNDIAEEDWDFWKRAQFAGARFACVPTVTWTYRMNIDWEHRSECVPSSSAPDLPTASKT